jgi:hypothetical protein
MLPARQLALQPNANLKADGSRRLYELISTNRKSKPDTDAACTVLQNRYRAGL